MLVDAFLALHQDPGDLPPVRLQIAGWLGKQHEAYAAEQFAKLDAAGLGHRYTYLGTVDRTEKLRMLSQLDVFSVPAVYREPKGLYVLEALAAGVPVVLPDHGAFPELVQATGGGQLVTPDDPGALAAGLRQLLGDAATRRRFSQDGQRAVLDRLNADAMARDTARVSANRHRPQRWHATLRLTPSHSAAGRSCRQHLPPSHRLGRGGLGATTQS